MTFLFLQLTNNATKGKIGVSSPFSEYVKFLPTRIPIPTFWNDQERLLLTGTSLEAALESKLKSLDREFTLIREKTISIDWCRQHWWDVETAVLMFADWRRVDALFRSRAVDLPGTGHAMVPCIDMANHASGNDTTSLYDTDSNGDAILTLRDGQSLTADSEVTITYGDEKGACEVLFSYGFIECSMTSARELFLDLEIPDDDPLKLAKKKIANSAPGFRLYESGDSIGWEGPFIWLIIVNEEDGLGFKVLQKETGERELQASWKDTAVSNLPELKELMEAEEGLWDIFNLRAVVTLQSRIEQQLLRLEGSKQLIDKVLQNELVEPGIRNYAWRLRELEETLMLHAYENFESKVISINMITDISLLIRPRAENTTIRIADSSRLSKRSDGTGWHDA